MAHIFPFLCAVARPTHPQGAYFVFPDLSAFGGSDGSLVAAPDEQLDSWLSLGRSENGASPPSYGNVNRGNWWSIRINHHSFFGVANFQINPWNGLKWYRENCHVFLVDFVIGGWNTSRQPYMVCPSIPNSHSGSSLSLVKLTTRWAIPIFGHKPIFLRLFAWICPGSEAKYLLDEHHIALVDGGMRYLICGKLCWALAKNDLMMANGWSG